MCVHREVCVCSFNSEERCSPRINVGTNYIFYLYKQTCFELIHLMQMILSSLKLAMDFSDFSL